jgi:hypothetical protein
MDTVAPNSNHFASRAVDIVQNGAQNPLNAATDPSWALTLAFAFGISLDIVTQRASALLISVHSWPLSVTESPVFPPQDGRLTYPPLKNSVCGSGWCL